MGARKNSAFRRLAVRKGEDLKAIYVKVKRSVTAADLQVFTQNEEGIPAEKVLAKLEALAKARPRKRKKT